MKLFLYIAFDIVIHVILVKLERYEIWSCVLDLMEKYFLNRKKYVKVHNTYSKTSVVSEDVPQGTIW